MSEHRTLGDALAARQTASHLSARHGWAGRVVFGVLNTAIWVGFVSLILWWVLADFSAAPALGIGLIGLGLAWIALAYWRRPIRARTAPHFLLSHDQHGFMGDLRLDAKSAIIDGNNIYHFGLGEDLGADALRLVAKQLRAEGFRVVCFFDANIFYTLIENGALSGDQRHSRSLLTKVFGLDASEIYVVPSGVQADKYIMSTLRHLPISFAVSNDQFRDYAKSYKSVMQGDQWRKGVSVKGAELKLHKFRFQTPLRVNGG